MNQRWDGKLRGRLIILVKVQFFTNCSQYCNCSFIRCYEVWVPAWKVAKMYWERKSLMCSEKKKILKFHSILKFFHILFFFIFWSFIIFSSIFGIKSFGAQISRCDSFMIIRLVPNLTLLVKWEIFHICNWKNNAVLEIRYVIQQKRQATDRLCRNSCRLLEAPKFGCNIGIQKIPIHFSIIFFILPKARCPGNRWSHWTWTTPQ